MICRLYNIGKTNDAFALDSINDFSKRLRKYIHFEYEDLVVFKKAPRVSEKERNQKEGEALLKKIKPLDYTVLLDERGKEFTSMEFAAWFEKKMNAGINQITFVTGGAYGFSPDVYKQANEKVSLSKMTFNHQLVRILFVEQLYRAFSIINNHPYHNE